MTRLLLGNLDCDLEFRGSRSQTLSASVLRTIAPFSTLLRVFAQEGDRLWTPGPVDPERVAAIDGLCRPELECGSPGTLEPGQGLLAWAETKSVEQLRRGVDRSPGPPGQDGPGLAERLWRIQPSSASIAARLNHRGFGLELARSLGCALPGAVLLDDLPALRLHLERGGSDASPSGRFVLKAPWSSSGRSRVIVRRSELQSRGPAERVAALFASHGELLFEPWMERQGDYGTAALSTADGVELVGVHSQELDPRDGRFLGLVLESGERPFTGLTAMERTTLEETTRAVGERLREQGYRGPFGLDAWRLLNRDGELCFHPMGEINVRMTMGLVVHALVERLISAGQHSGDATIRFRVGQADDRRAPAPELIERIELVHPESGGTGGVWLEWRACGG